MLGCVGHDETAAPLRLTQPIRIQGDQQNPTLSLTRRDQDTIVGQGDRKGIGGAVVSTRRRGFVVSRIPRHFTMTDPRMTVVGRDGRMQDVPTAVGVGKSQAFVPEKDQSIVRQADQACRRIGREQGGRSRGRPLCTICGERLVESSELCANQHPQIIWPAFDDHGLHSTIGADTRRLHLEFSVVNPPGLSIVAREHDRFARAGKPEGVQALASRSPGAICELGKGQHETPILHLDGGIDRPRIPLPDSNGISQSSLATGWQPPQPPRAGSSCSTVSAGVHDTPPSRDALLDTSPLVPAASGLQLSPSREPSSRARIWGSAGMNAAFRSDRWAFDEKP